MALINNDWDKTIQELIDDALFLKEYNKAGTLTRPDYDKKTADKVFSHFYKCLKKILSNEDGRCRLIKELNNDKPYVRFLAARYLYPVMKKESMSIMKKYLKSLKDKIEIFEVKTVIEGLSNNQKVFVDQFKKLYGCDDLDSLNQEKVKNKEKPIWNKI